MPMAEEIGSGARNCLDSTRSAQFANLYVVKDTGANEEAIQDRFRSSIESLIAPQTDD